MKRQLLTIPSLFTTLLIGLTLSLGCEREYVVGGESDDSGPGTLDASFDAGAMDAESRDARVAVDSGAEDSGSRDGGGEDGGAEDSGARDSGTRDGGVVEGELFTEITLTTSYRSHAPHASLGVLVHDAPYVAPESRELDSTADCQVIEQRVQNSRPHINIGTAVSYRIPGGSWTSVPEIEDFGFTTNLPSDIEAGTTVDVRVDIPGRSSIERALVVARVRQSAPVVIPTTINYRYDYPADTDLSLDFDAEGSAGVVTLLASPFPSATGGPFYRSARCQDEYTARSMTLPLELLTQILDIAPEVQAVTAWLLYRLSLDTRVEDGVEVEAVSAAVSQIATASMD